MVYTQQPPAEAAGGVTAPARGWLLAAALAISVIFVVRCAAAYTHPVLWGDDWHLFTRFVWEPGLSLILQTHAGYVSFLPSLIGGIASWLPLGWQPYALAWAPGVIGVLSLSWFASSRFAHVVPDPGLRCLACVMLAMLPASNAPLVSATTFSSWHLLFVLCLAVIVRPPEGKKAVACEFVVLSLCACSHPVSVLLGPFFVVRGLAARGSALRLHYLALSGVAVAYFLCGVGSSVGELGDWRRPAHAALEMLTHWVLGDSVLPGHLRTELPTGWIGHALLLLPLVAVGAFIVRGGERARSQRVVVASLIALSLGVIAANIAGRHAEYGKLVFSPRYTYVPTLCWYLAGMVTLFWFVQGRSRLLRVAVLVGLVLHTTALNRGRGYRYRTSPADGDKVVAFVKDLETWQPAATGGPSERSLALPGRRLTVHRPPPTARPALPR